MTLEGRVALVTGANRSIGKSISLALAGQGASVAVHFYSNSNDANAVVDEIVSGGGRAAAFQSDVSNRDEVERMVAECSGALGPVNILVNNARQLVKGRTFLELNWEDDYVPQIEVMLRGTFNCCQAILPSMIEKGWGRIINILSTVLGEHRARTNSYGTVKSALLYFPRIWPPKWGRMGSRSTWSLPGCPSPSGRFSIRGTTRKSTSRRFRQAAWGPPGMSWGRSYFSQAMKPPTSPESIWPYLGGK